MKLSKIVLLGLVLSLPNTTKAAFSVNGFIAQGVINSFDSEFVTEPNDWTLALTELGINGRFTVNERVQLVAQAVYLNSGNRYPEGGRLDYAFLDYALIRQQQVQLNVHLGRFKNQNWLYSATQDVPHTRPTIVLPQSIYFDGFRDISLSSDGVSLLSTWFRPSGELQVNWSLGKSEFSDEFNNELLGGRPIGDVEQDFIHQIGLGWSPYHSPWHFRVSYLDSTLNYDINDNGFNLRGQSSFSRYQVSTRYSAEFFEITSEVLAERVNINAAPLFDIDQTGIGGYLQGHFFVSPKLSLLTRFDIFYPDRDDKSGQQLSARFAGEIPQYAGFVRTYTLGVRWDINNRWRLHAEHHWVEGAARLTPLVTPLNLPFTERRWRTVAVQLMTWF